MISDVIAVCPNPVPEPYYRDNRHVATVKEDAAGFPVVIRICEGCGQRLRVPTPAETSEENRGRWLLDTWLIREHP